MGDRGFKIVVQSGCGDADHSDGLNGTACSGTKEVNPPPVAHGHNTLFGEKTEKGECEANFNYLPDVFWEEAAGRVYRLGVGLNGLNILLWTMEHDSFLRATKS